MLSQRRGNPEQSLAPSLLPTVLKSMVKLPLTDEIESLSEYLSCVEDLNYDKGCSLVENSGCSFQQGSVMLPEKIKLGKSLVQTAADGIAST